MRLDMTSATQDSVSEVVPFYQSLFHLCASHLYTLDWSPCQYMDRKLEIKLPSLLNLRELKVSNVFPAIIPAIVSARNTLRTLDVGGRTDSESLRELLSSLGTMPSLSSLRLSLDSPYIWKSFLSSNSHLKKLSVFIKPPLMPPSEQIAKELLVLLINSFKDLRSLSLGWSHAQGIPETWLSQIGQLTTLKRLHISAGYMVSVLVDHSTISHHLSRLSGLEYLAISGDTYPAVLPKDIGNVVEPEPSDYYEDLYFESEGEFDPEESLTDDDGEQDDLLTYFDDYLERRRSKRTTGHCDRMLKHAALYLPHFANLKWIFFGKIVMEPDPETPGSMRKSEMLVPGANTSELTSGDMQMLLSRMFGWPHGTWFAPHGA